MPSPLMTATLQAASLSSASNILAQLTNSYQQKIPFVLDFKEFLRFVILAFVTTPPNYKWQQFLERYLPAYAPGSNDESPALPLTRRDIKEQKEGRDLTEDLSSKPKLNIKNTLLKWFIDCMTAGALLNTIAFLILMGLLKSQSWQHIMKNVQTETLPIIVSSYKIWPIASVVNFAFIPVEKRIVFLSCVGLFWNIYMSLVAASL